ncbi:InlB B-repeat-containing protein [Streptomyces tritici]|uniref:InlB B-repeat-containing protein n=1 Tax=Streptomyces tritici TaxID=2054410 RepID=UPI003AF08C8E
MRRHRSLLVGAGLLALASLAAPPASSDTDPVADEPAWVLRSRTERLDPKEYAALCAARPAGAPGTRTLDLFPDVSVTAVADRVERDARGTVTWAGHVPGRPERTVLLTVTGACAPEARAASTAVDAVVTLGPYTYTLSAAPGRPGRVRIAEVDPGKRPQPVPDEVGAGGPAPGASPSGPATEPGGAAHPTPPPGPATEPAAAPATDPDPVVIDLLVGHTPKSAERIGGAAAMRARIALADAALDSALADSGVRASVDVVAVYEAAYDGSERAQEVYGRLADPDDRELGAPAAELRERHGADLAALLVTVPAGTSTGYGSLPQPPAATTDHQAYSVTDVDSVVDWFNFGHEVGHNLGLWHDRATLERQTGGLDYTRSLTTPYSTGWITADGRFHTLMAYGSSCPGECAPVNRYANTVRGWQGEPLGDAHNDNARVARWTAPIVAAYRTPATPVARHALTLAAAPATAGTVAPATWGPYRPGTEVTVTATPKKGHVFAGWELDGAALPHKGDTLALPMTKPHTLKARFSPAP